MFPIPFNFPFRKKDGSLTSIGAAIDAGGGGEPYILPTASGNTKGGVKIGNLLTMDGEVLNADDQLPAHTSSDEGKFLGVDDAGALEWSIPSGSGVEYRAGVTNQFNAEANNSYSVNVTFNIPMPDTDYSVVFGLQHNAVDPSIRVSLPPFVVYNKTTNGFTIWGWNNQSDAVNFLVVHWLAIAFK